MLRTLIVAILLCIPTLVLSKSIPIDGCAARVNGETIMVTDVLAAMHPVLSQIRLNYKGKEQEQKLIEAYENTLNSLIERELILDNYRQNKEFIIPDSVVNIQIDELVHIKFNNNRLKFIQALEADGITIDQWRENVKKHMIVSMMRKQMIESKIMISPAATRKTYEKNIERYRIPGKVELSIITIHRGKTSEEIALKKRQMEKICERLKQAESFSKLAKEVSEDSKAANGGYWGWVEPESRRPELVKALATLNAGEISNVIEAGNYFYILTISGRKNATVVPFEDVQDSIRDEIKQEKSQRVYTAWISHLKEKAYIKKF